jgi:RNA polymerase sigma factor (sigma-70 family)
MVNDVRPRLHRFCARMCGSVLDGEDVVQETLAQAFYALPSLKDESRLEAWLFRIAHHKCIGFLRRPRLARRPRTRDPCGVRRPHAASPVKAWEGRT